MSEIIIGEPLGVGWGTIQSEASEQEVGRLVNLVNDRYLVSTDLGAYGVCGDGRACSHTLANTEAIVSPKVFGGPLVAAYAGALLLNNFLDNSSPVIDWIKDRLQTSNIVIGGHVSDGAIADTNGSFLTDDSTPKTGCGANDSFVNIANTAISHQGTIDEISNILLGANDTSDLVTSEVLSDKIANYSSKNTLDNMKNNANGKNIEILEGQHQEQFAIFNYRDGKTLDRDRFVNDTDKQIFDVDMWYIDDIVEAMASDKDESTKTQLKRATVAFQIATCLVLCDGSLRPVIIK